MQSITGPETDPSAPEVSQALIDWLSLPERDRAELLGGRIVYSLSSGRARISARWWPTIRSRW